MSTIPESVKVGQNTVFEKNVTIGENVVIGHNTVILEGTEIGDNVTIGSNCVLGIKPNVSARMRKTEQKKDKLIIESGTRIGHLVSIYAGTQISQNVFVGDQASIRENVRIGNTSVVGRSAVVELNSTIGRACTIQTLAYITGDTTLEDDVFIGPCVSMSNDKYMGAKPYELEGPFIKKGAKIGNNASLLPGIIIGQETIVGAGSVVTKDVGDYKVIAGVPSKDIHS
ncbi:transferase hexapeptide (six repeat-containing protein) [Salinibacillus kushneri]|uniref:Transferase hexapeptide (Six repeat-containing protein) n=1 Tax=Salinibacillus kushneri TaxID=237682 RepID=A0A1I0AG08_9BACI|nr:DapH/DapD/GlmU-related protein [Salinibacillus kushneri]SES93197.1 transferase hexapeptide (six repeat-containing protein) [Salinibacillus kushneri]